MKKAVFSPIKGLLFSRVPQIFFGPSYFEVAINVIIVKQDSFSDKMLIFCSKVYF